MTSSKSSTSDCIEKEIWLDAPRSRVWRALTTAAEFGAWFGVELEGEFAPGQAIQGKVTHPEYRHVTWKIVVDRIEPERLFSWHWYPFAIDASADYSGETPTLVVFELEDVDGGTRLTLVESGFDRVPAARRAKAFEMNDMGWGLQMKAIEKHVGTASGT